MLQERYELAMDRIREIAGDNLLKPEYQAFFNKTALFLIQIEEAYRFVKSGELYRAKLTQLQEHNRALYEDILQEHYAVSYANPVYAVKELGTEHGRQLSFLYTELRGLIAYAYEQCMVQIVIRLELYLEIYQSFICAAEEEKIPAAEDIKGIIYSFVSDYAVLAAKEKLAGLLDPERNFAYRVIMEHDLSDVRYLYYYGEYVTGEEVKTARHLLSQTPETIAVMADTYTEGYRIGFTTTNKDISKKKTVNVRYCLGFERMIKKAVENFAAMGLRPTIYRSPVSVMEGKGAGRTGYFGAIPNRQYDYDHKEDMALILDKALVNKRLEALKTAFEEYKEKAAIFGGPAVVEIFGEALTAPAVREEAPRYHEKQQKLSVDYAAAAGELQNSYIKGEERSFTIIAFPTPHIGADFPAIFDEVIRINTLSYELYQGIQQVMIDTLDQGEYVMVKGMNGNKTNLKIMLRPLTNPERETNFENCVADVNIPVGEVFTSPQLSGTEGTLHVKEVYLNELKYKDIMLEIQDGMITGYACANFETAKENRKYIRDNVLFHHDTLPMGEFAIGTNTTAYTVCKKYNIGDKLPILIAEKMGPHFAFGDTCYSHAEDVKVYNPDGKEIVARDNEISIKRRENPRTAYFNCHTDITIPYDELGELSVVTRENRVITIIENGRFSLAGCEELNKAFEN